MITEIITTIGATTALAKQLKSIWDQIRPDGYGSKVKMGAYDGCSIEKFDGKVCILIDEQHIIFLTPDTISSCYRYQKKKYKTLRGKYYHYYDITFKNGEFCKIRVSEGKKKLMEDCGVYIQK